LYDDGDGDPFGYAFAYSGDLTWSYNNNTTDGNIIPNAGKAGNVDMGIWAYRDNSARVPEPTSLVLLGLGLAAIGFSRYTKA